MPAHDASSAAAADEGSDEAVVARIGDRVITGAEIDASIQLAVHDLEMQKYRLRRQALEAELLQRLSAASTGERTAQVLLAPPSPPRLPVQPDPDRLRPPGETPVTVLAFCDFESPHCARLQLTLSQVLPLFSGVVRYAERDLPLVFHRHATKAAEAARCAGDQGNYWRFHDVLYSAGGPPDRAALQRAARSVNLDARAFATCLDSGRYGVRIGDDVALAASLGITAVPAVFVNGLYASPDVKPADLVWLIERELRRLHESSPRDTHAATRSGAPFHLQALLVSPTPGQGAALLAPSVAPERVAAFREGDAIATDVVLMRIDSGGIDVLHDGRAERLELNAAPARPSALATDAATADDLAAEYPHRAVPVTLDRARVLVLMSDRIALAQALQPVPMTAGGQRLLKLQAVASGGLYELLGFEAGDVIVSVNEQPVTEAFNPLWDALQKEGEVRVRVMRRGGLAQHFTYRMQD